MNFSPNNYVFKIFTIFRFTGRAKSSTVYPIRTKKLYKGEDYIYRPRKKEKNKSFITFD